MVIEVPRLTFVKRKPCGSVDFVSPLPCPYNYGSIEGTLGPDGDPLDALVLGPRLPFGARVESRVRGVIHFEDDGAFDPKIVCSPEPLTQSQRKGIERFFYTYMWLKRAIYLRRLRRGRARPTRYLGWLGDGWPSTEE